MKLTAAGWLTGFLTILTIGGCGEPAGPETSFAGTYDLVGIDGVPLPLTQGGVTVTAGALTLGDDWSAHMVLEVLDPAPRSVDVLTGGYSVAASILALTGRSVDGDPLAFTGTISRDAVHLDATGSEMQFRSR